MSAPDLVPSAVAGVLGLKLQSSVMSAEAVARAIAGKKLLLVLDNCEHVIAAAATLAEKCLRLCPRITILATSREIFRIQGEFTYRVPPIDVPALAHMEANQILGRSAPELFITRAKELGSDFSSCHEILPTIAEICRRLDGIPLAIEFAAARAATLGVEEVAAGLRDRFAVLTGSRRTALSRHQTLRATLDWSYRLLPDFERHLLQRLAIFSGSFSLAAINAVANREEVSEAEIADGVQNLVAKSLLTSDLAVAGGYFRLLETTRAYALSGLTEGGELEECSRRHAEYYLGVLENIENDSAQRALPLAHLDNVRAALQWCFGLNGSPASGVRLAAVATPVFLALSLLSECQRWCERAAAALPQEDRGTLRELALRSALAMSSIHTRGNSDEVRIALEQGLALAESLGDHQRLLRLLTWLHVFLNRIGDHSGALAIAQCTASVARAIGELPGIAIAEWLFGVTHHMLGNQAAAQEHCERGLELSAASTHGYVDVFGYDHDVRALIALARALWLRGRPERALVFANQAIDAAERRDRPVMVCLSLVSTIPVFIWTGEIDEAWKCVERAIVRANKHSLGPFRDHGLALKGEILIARGETVAGVQVLRGALATVQSERYNILASSWRRALAEGSVRCGAFDDAKAMIAEALALAQEGDGKFDMPDLLRARADILLVGPQPDVATAEASLVASLEWSRQQSALGWELRAATQLARLWARQGHADRARNLIAGVYQRFTEGFETADLKIAARLLAELGTEPRGPMYRPVSRRSSRASRSSLLED